MDFASLIEPINMLLDRLVEGAKLQPKTTPETLAAELASAVSLLLGLDPGVESEDRPVGPVGPIASGNQPSFAQMSGLMSYTIRQYPLVLRMLNQLLSAADMKKLPANTKPEELAGSLTQLLMEDLRKQVAAAAPAMAQMGGRLAKGSSSKRALSDQYEQFKRAGYRPEKALKMARNVSRS